MKATNSRGVSAQIVCRWLKTSDFPNRLLASLELEHRAFVMEMVYGVVRRRRLLEWVVERCASRMPEHEVRSFLFVGLYQLLFMTSIAPYAAVNETVDAVKIECSQAQADFVNAVLRKVVREKDALLTILKSQPVGIQQSHPDILVDRWNTHFGPEAAQKLCEWNNNRPDVVIRINCLKVSPVEYRAALDARQIKMSSPSSAGREWFSLGRGIRIEELPGYKEGHFLVLDPSVMTAVELLDPQPGERVLDACAAPGGKTFLIAERMRKQGALTALELHQDRLPRLRNNMNRLGCDDFVEVVQDDAAKLAHETWGSFDRILLDVPCTNTGVIRRRPDVRWRFSKARLARMISTQRTILEHMFCMLKPGGSLVYSTCSLEPEENEDLIVAYMKNKSDCHLIKERKLFPPDSGTDGAYAVLLRKQA